MAVLLWSWIESLVLYCVLCMVPKTVHRKLNFFRSFAAFLGSCLEYMEIVEVMLVLPLSVCRRVCNSRVCKRQRSSSERCRVSHEDGVLGGREPAVPYVVQRNFVALFH